MIVNCCITHNGSLPHLVCWVTSAVVLVVDADGPVAKATIPRASTGGLVARASCLVVDANNSIAKASDMVAEASDMVTEAFDLVVGVGAY